MDGLMVCVGCGEIIMSEVPAGRDPYTRELNPDEYLVARAKLRGAGQSNAFPIAARNPGGEHRCRGKSLFGPVPDPVLLREHGIELVMRSWVIGLENLRLCTGCGCTVLIFHPNGIVFDPGFTQRRLVRSMIPAKDLAENPMNPVPTAWFTVPHVCPWGIVPDVAPAVRRKKLDDRCAEGEGRNECGL